MQLRILHKTAYTYEEPVKYTAQKLRLNYVEWDSSQPSPQVLNTSRGSGITDL